jgi:hypothetical protein
LAAFSLTIGTSDHLGDITTADDTSGTAVVTPVPSPVAPVVRDQSDAGGQRHQSEEMLMTGFMPMAEVVALATAVMVSRTHSRDRTAVLWRVGVAFVIVCSSGRWFVDAANATSGAPSPAIQPTRHLEVQQAVPTTGRAVPYRCPPWKRP